MADQQQPGVLDSLSDTVVIGFELVGAEMQNLPDRLAKALRSAELQSAIRNALNEFAQERIKNTPTTVSPQEAQELAKKIADAGLQAVGDNVVNQIKSSARYKELDQSVKQLLDSLKKTPVGVWINENKTAVYIIGVGAVLGGAAAMYVTRQGDGITKTLLPALNGKSVSFKALGSLEIKAGIEKVQFTPSQRSIEAKTFASLKWQRVEANLNLAVTAADGTATAAAKGQVLVPIKGSVVATAGGGYDSATKDWSLNVGVGIGIGGSLQIGVWAATGKGGLAGPPSNDVFKAVPAAPGGRDDRTHGFVGLGISGTF